MKCLIVVALLLLFGMLFSSVTVRESASCLITKNISVLVLGSNDLTITAEKCYDLMIHCYMRPANIMYLSVDPEHTPRSNKIADKANVTWALTEWLRENSDSTTQVWLWFFSHGRGLQHMPMYDEWYLAEGARLEWNSDEGEEVSEAMLRQDLNHDGLMSPSTWLGVDEGMSLFPSYVPTHELIYDDELKQMLQGLNAERTIISFTTCTDVNTGANTTSPDTCFCGGYIDDLSGPRRIIMTSTNETYFGYYNYTNGMSYFWNPFFDAMWYGSTASQEASQLIDNDGLCSVLEAFEYARAHDMARKQVRNPTGGDDLDPWRDVLPRTYREIDENPWMDDGGNFMPTFIHGADSPSSEWLAYYGRDGSDGELAQCTWLLEGFSSMCRQDVNNDFTVDIQDVSMAATIFGRAAFPSKWVSRASLVDVNRDDKVDIKDIAIIADLYGWKFGQ